MLSIPQEERDKYPPFKALETVLDAPGLSDTQKMRAGMAFTFALGRSSKGDNLDPVLIKEQAGWLKQKLGLGLGIETKLVDVVVKGFNEFCAAEAAKQNGRG